MDCDSNTVHNYQVDGSSLHNSASESFVHISNKSSLIPPVNILQVDGQYSSNSFFESQLVGNLSQSSTIMSSVHIPQMDGNPSLSPSLNSSLASIGQNHPIDGSCYFQSTLSSQMVGNCSQNNISVPTVHIGQMDGNYSINSSVLSSASDSTDSHISDIPFSEESLQSSDESSLYQSSSSSLNDNEHYESSCGEDDNLIPVLVNVDFCNQAGNYPQPSWYDQHQNYQEYRRTIRIKMPRDNKIIESMNLPIISVSNLRSLMPKINNFKDDMLEREISLALLSEVWEQAQNKKHKFEIEKLCELDGLKYISTPRVSTKRGGGAAIVANLRKFSLEKITVNNPHNLEVVWGLLKPKGQILTRIKQILVCAFYSPPNSKKNNKLLDHIISTFHHLLTKYPEAGIVIGGDKNKLNISPLINAIPKLRQIVTKFTYKQKILDIILTNLHQFYCVPVIVPPVLPDRAGHGVPSDHDVPVAHPKAVPEAHVNEYKTVTSRPLPESGIREFGQWICDEKWVDLKYDQTPTEQAQLLQEILSEKVEKFFPKKIFRVSRKDKPYITKELKQLDRAKKRIYKKHGKSIKYLELKARFDAKLIKAAEEYLTKNSKLLKTSNPSKAYATLKKMGAQPGEFEDEGSFTLSEHLDLDLSVKESVNRIAQHFAAISQEYPPLNPSTLPPR